MTEQIEQLEAYKFIGDPQTDAQNWKNLTHRNIRAAEKRGQFIRKFGFVLFSEQTLEEIVEFNRRILSIGCGCGYLEHWLRKYGARMHVTDIQTLKNNSYGFIKRWTRVEVMSHRVAMDMYSKPGVAILISWPHFDVTWDAEVLDKIHDGQKLIYIGEGVGDCTGSKPFHQKLEKEFTKCGGAHIYSWFGIHDRCEFYTKGSKDD